MVNASETPNDPVIVVTNPDDDVSPAAFRALLDDLLAGNLSWTRSVPQRL